MCCGVSCFVLVPRGFPGLRPPLRCFVVLCVVVCVYWVVCFVVSVFACRVGVGLVLSFVMSCYVSWRILCRGVLCCRVVFWCVGSDVGVWRRAVLCVVACRFVALYSMLRCAPLLSRWLWVSFSCCRVCCCLLCLGVVRCCGFILLVVTHCCAM